MYNRAKRVLGSEEAMILKIGEPVDNIISRILHVIHTCRAVNRALHEDEMVFLFEAWMMYRYELAEERLLIDETPGDYCTIIFTAMCESPLDSVPAQRLRNDIRELCDVLHVEWDCSDERVDRISWFKQTLWDMSAWRDILTFTALEKYDACIAGCIALGLAILRDEAYTVPSQIDVAGWRQNGRGAATVSFVDDVEPWLCGLLQYHTFAELVTQSSDVEMVIYDNTPVALGAGEWLYGCFREMAFDHYTTLYYNNYLEHCARPGECFKYHKDRLFRPNWPREALEIVRPRAFQDAYHSSTATKAVFQGEALPVTAGGGLEMARNVGALVAAAGPLASGCGIDLRKRVVSSSQYECYGGAIFSGLSYPTIAWLGTFMVVMEKKTGGSRLLCNSMLDAICLLVSLEASTGNFRAERLIQRWSQK